MAKQTLLWTALPNGYGDDADSLRVSLLLSPRLEPDGDATLDAFPDFHDWPATLAQARIALHFDTSVATLEDGTLTIDDGLATADSTVWHALFPDPTKTPVHGFKFRDLSNYHILSYPTVAIDNMVRELYRRLAAAANDQLPTFSEILKDPEWRHLVAAVADTDRSDYLTDYNTGVRNTKNWFAAFKGGAFDGDHPQQVLSRFQLYHTPPSTPQVDRYKKPRDEAQASAQWLGYKQTELPQANQFKDQIDFHKIVAAMNQYPTLLRKLGLVVDLLVDRDAFVMAADKLLWVEVTLPHAAESIPEATPRTHTLLDRSRFQAVSIGTGDFRIRQGLLDLKPTAFQLLQSDVDAAGLKLSNFARTLARVQQTGVNQVDPVTKKEREAGAPALRNAGLMLVHSDRASMLKNNFTRQLGFDNAKPPVMHAEDLLRGYRIDIWDDVSGRWHSLCQREATYILNDGEAVIAVDEEEGTVRLAATTSPDEKSNADIIWLHEALLSWTGWSLCAPPPGRTISHDGSDHSDPITDAEPVVPAGLHLQTVFKAIPGSLPRLRYGRKYWIRARIVDLAGNSLALQPKDFGLEFSQKNASPYFRFEPISAPAIALVRSEAGVLETPAEGESMERMAVRSLNDVPALNTVTTTQRARRFAVPGRTTQRDAEHHGMFDRRGVVDPSFFAKLVAKDNSLAEEKILTAGPLDEGPPVETGYAVMQEGEALPYLPEPLAALIAARIFDHPTFSSNDIIKFSLYPGATQWPDAVPFKIELYEDPADKPHFDNNTRTLFVPLPKAARATLRLSVRPSAEAFKILGVWNWLTEAQKASQEELARKGQHWMLTPWRNIELVHAVQRPLLAPEMKTLTINRELGKTHAHPIFDAQCSVASTDHIDLHAQWHEPFEDATKHEDDRARTDHAFAIKITDPKSYGGLHEFVLVADDLIQVGKQLHDKSPPKVHEFNNTRYRRIEYWLEVTTKFREFMPANILVSKGGKGEPTDANIKVVGSTVRRWIESSAPPPAPDVLYVVPTFGWVRSGNENSQSSWRRGGGLRVYLSGPWNVSGYGEMLGVILPRAGFVGNPDKEPAEHPLKSFVTQWGNDPIWLSPFVAGIAPRRANFPLARFAPDPDGKWLPAFAPAAEADQPPGAFAVTDRSLPDLPKTSPDSGVEVAPHDVFYDKERNLWYCDIEITWGRAYYPFIRLALARYQPVSVDGAHLSHVVLADFMPLVPDRWLNVTSTPEPRTCHVSVFGHTYSDSSSHVEAQTSSARIGVTASSVMEVWVEHFDPALGEDFGWKREPDAIVQKDVAASPWRSVALRKTTAAQQRIRAKELHATREFGALIDEGLIDKIFATPTLWKGSVTLPQAPAEGARYRLAIAEYEEYFVDGDEPYDPVPTKKDQRLVFIEYVELA
jgi:hypothetical protein